jgi:hypothetical protein
VQTNLTSSVEESLILEVRVNSVVVPVLDACYLLEAQLLVEGVVFIGALFRAVLDLLAVALQKLLCHVV